MSDKWHGQGGDVHSSDITMSMALNHFLTKKNFPFGKMQPLQCKNHAEYPFIHQRTYATDQGSSKQ
jgi:hypothetical protein